MFARICDKSSEILGKELVESEMSKVYFNHLSDMIVNILNINPDKIKLKNVSCNYNKRKIVIFARCDYPEILNKYHNRIKNELKLWYKNIDIEIKKV